MEILAIAVSVISICTLLTALVLIGKMRSVEKEVKDIHLFLMRTVVSATVEKRKYRKSGKYSTKKKAYTKKGRPKLNGWKRRRISQGIKAYWDNLTPEQKADRLARMKRARKVNKQFKLQEIG